MPLISFIYIEYDLEYYFMYAYKYRPSLIVNLFTVATITMCCMLRCKKRIGRHDILVYSSIFPHMQFSIIFLTLYII
jgi:hypothetical protein